MNFQSKLNFDCNLKLILGLIWTLIINFQISKVIHEKEPNSTNNGNSSSSIIKVGSNHSIATTMSIIDIKTEVLERTEKLMLKDTKNKYELKTTMANLTHGIVLISLICKAEPTLINMESIRNNSPIKNLQLAFNILEEEFGVPKLLEPQDVLTENPDDKVLLTYMSLVVPAVESYNAEERKIEKLRVKLEEDVRKQKK